MLGAIAHSFGTRRQRRRPAPRGQTAVHLLHQRLLPDTSLAQLELGHCYHLGWAERHLRVGHQHPLRAGIHWFLRGIERRKVHREMCTVFSPIPQTGCQQLDSTASPYRNSIPQLYTATPYRNSIPQLYTATLYLDSIPQLYTATLYPDSIPRLHTAIAYCDSIPQLYTATLYCNAIYCDSLPRLYTQGVGCTHCEEEHTLLAALLDTATHDPCCRKWGCRWSSGGGGRSAVRREKEQTEEEE